MADWCKLYENEFDHEELRWALSKQPHAGWVYAVLLTRCARDKTGNFNWSDPNRSLFALADACVLSPPVVNDCLNALKEIGFIDITDKHIKVLSWNKKQSEWCKRATSKPLRSNFKATSKPLQSNSEVTTDRSEERRGDQSRGEHPRSESADVELPAHFPKTEKEAVAHADFAGVTEAFAAKTYHKALSRGGNDAKGQPIRLWRHYLKAESVYDQERVAKNSPANGSVSHAFSGKTLEQAKKLWEVENPKGTFQQFLDVWHAYEDACP